MVEYQAPALDRVFHALSDPTRRAMLRRLADGEHNIRALAAPFAMSFTAASKHLKVLESAGLVSRRVQGRSHLCRIDAAPLAAIDQWLKFYERFWNARLDMLETLLRADAAPSVPSQPDQDPTP
ncbi:ArsR/SmtB family transcription factor [Bordetella genomosp. 6]|uniref:ArsR/SmtB family transcription factor n=1 Tax=Bordetella genomosp. 6 TaxID=463024 RepID=UPI000A294994|nr:metalloregulator ArsR/SmtB family transcription factor [Bordetella genomosp. 6]ARP76897.1 transcriptional regulator [Bordetella genomosp. 6]